MTYELKELKLPKLNGFPLKLFAAALDNKLLGSLLLPQLLKDAGFPKLQATKLNEPPTYAPIAFQHQTKQPPEGNVSISLESLEKEKGIPQENIPFHTIRDYAQAYRAGTTNPMEVAQRIYDSIQESDRGNRPLRAFIACDQADLMRQAKESTKRFQEGTARSLLEGVPIACKDEVDQMPYPTTVGTSFLGKQPATEDATVVAKLRAAGALLLGKTNMHEIGINPTGANVHYGTARNPYNLGHDPGGSSSGSAASVAANLCPVAVSADGGGSIRIPAAFCGLVGLKATYARISEYGAAPLCWSVGHLGPIAATTEDAALMYAVIAGKDPKDPHTLHQPPPSLEGWNNTDLTGFTMGVYRPWFEHATPDIVEACEAQIEHFQSLGATVKEIDIPMLDEMRIAHAISILSEMATSMEGLAPNNRSFGPTVRINLNVGYATSSRIYIHAQRMRTKAIHIFDEVLQQVDVIVTPATAIVSPPIPQNDQYGWSDLSSVTESMRFVVPGNLTGLPAINFPVGYDKNGLPISMQIMGRAWEEALLLRFSHASEQHMKKQKPALHYNIL